MHNNEHKNRHQRGRMKFCSNIDVWFYDLSKSSMLEMIYLHRRSENIASPLTGVKKEKISPETYLGDVHVYTTL